MTSASPWSVKGIDPKARELAKDLARRSGMTLGEWLNQMIIEGDADVGDDIGPARSAFAAEAGDRRDIRMPSDRYAARPGAEGEVRRIARALEALTQRLESAEHRSTLAISGIDQSVMGVLSRIEAVERDRVAVAARFDGELEEMRASQARVADRLRRLSDDDGPRVEAMRSLEVAIGKVAEKLYDAEAKTRSVLNEAREDMSHAVRRIDRLEARVEGDPAPALVDALSGRVGERISAVLADRLGEAEARTSAAIAALQESFSGLDSRLGAVEGADLSGRLDALARDFARQVEAQRAELADRLARLADTRVDGVESSLNDLAARVGVVESQSAQAIDRMGREVMRIAQTLGERVASVEARSAEATQQIGGEMARIAQAMEARMARNDQAQAEALEKLGGEISRIAERLADRIAHAERRSSEAVDAVSSELGRAAEQISARHDAGHAALAERIRASEQRTAQLLDEARDAIDRRLFEAQRRFTAPSAAAVGAVEPLPEPGFGAAEPASPVLAATAARDEAASPFTVAETPAPDRLTWPPEPVAEADPFLSAPLSTQTLHASPAAAADPFTGFQDSFATDGEAADVFVPAPPPVEARPTRDVIAEARAAARAASEKPDRRSRDRLEPIGEAAEIAASRFSFTIPGRKKRKNDGLRTVLTASGTAAALAMTAVGATLYLGSEAGKTDQVDRSSPPPTAARAEPKGAGDPAAPGGDSKPDSYAAVALAPAATPGAALPAGPISQATASAPSAPAPTTPITVKPVEAQPLYNAAVGRLSAGDASGVDDLKKAANLGFAPAQFYLSKLYESGGSGLKKDLTEARRWIQRAAEGGDAQAMHNLAIYALNGEGGPRNPELAVQWFTRAANRGLVDSQFNLGRLYEVGGYGVPQNKVEAYKWYLLAAAGADHDARVAADALKAQLPPDQARTAERSALAFRPVKSDRAGA